ncbi:MAG: hypothetical protein QG670_387 [Thermoproteota archaeon]|nr:hypothetical protein [Thermoproteota archaeon]
MIKTEASKKNSNETSSGSVEFWLGRMKPSSWQTTTSNFGLFMKWLKAEGGPFRDYSPDMLVEYQRSSDNSHRYDILNLVQRYISAFNGRKATKRVRYALVRSFFMHNRAELPMDRGFKIRGNEPRIIGTLTVEEARNIILSSNPCFQAAFLCMFQGGLGSHELLYWSNNGLEKLLEDLRENKSIIRIDLPGRKDAENDRSFYSLIGGDAIAALKKWMKLRPADAESIFTSDIDTPLKYHAIQSYWRRKLRRLGIYSMDCGSRKYKLKSNRKVGGTGKNLHELRDLFRTQFAKSPAKADVAEFMMGHSIDANEYNKAYRDEKFYRDEYEKALPYLQIISSGRPFHQVSEEEVERLRSEVERLKKGDNQDVEGLKRQMAEMEKMMKGMQTMIGALNNQRNRASEIT